MEIDTDTRKQTMENLQAVIDRHMKDAQTIWADDKDMQTMVFEDAVTAFAIKKDIEKGLITEAVERFAKLDTAPLEDNAVALKTDKGRDWTEETFGIRFA